MSPTAEMRAVLDPNVIVSAVLSPTGTPATLLRSWLAGNYELITSPRLLDELQRVLGYPKIARRIDPSEAHQLLTVLRTQTSPVDDPHEAPSVRSPDPGDDYLIGLAESAAAIIVSGDSDLQDLAGQIPAYSPAAFLALLNPT